MSPTSYGVLVLLFALLIPVGMAGGVDGLLGWCARVYERRNPPSNHSIDRSDTHE